MVTSLIKHSTDKNHISMEPHVMEATNRLREFMFESVYTNPSAKGEESKAKEILVRLFEYYVKHPQKMPELYYRNTKTESVERCVCNFVSAMTDRFAIEKYKELFIPEVWRG
jgi:dGTPase